MNPFFDTKRFRMLKQHHKDWTPHVLSIRPWVAFGLVPVTCGLVLAYLSYTLAGWMAR